MHQYSPQDIFVAGYPKSGNTWFQALMAGAVYGVLPELVPLSMVQYLVPDVHVGYWYKRHAKTMFFKTHWLPRPEYRRVIYLLRDGRDAMVSYLHYRGAIAGQKLDFMEFLNDNRLFPCKWYEHVEAWLANPHKAEMIIVRYEDLKADPLKELQRVCEFSGLSRSDQVLNMAIQGASFKNMQAKEKTEGWFMNNFPKGKDKLFCRRGEVGSYQQEMPREALEAFMREATPMLRQCGYC